MHYLPISLVEVECGAKRKVNELHVAVDNVVESQRCGRY